MELTSGKKTCPKCSHCIRVDGIKYSSITNQIVTADEGCYRFKNPFKKA